MAMHGKAILIRLVHKETGYFYVSRKNPKNTPDKIKLRKYNPVTRKTELFVEEKIK